jgi:S1-C subfamily serine protease
VGTTTGWNAAPIADSKEISIGSSVIRIGGKGADTVGSGVVATLPNTESPELIAASVESATPGSVLMTIFGEVIGISTGASIAEGTEFYTVASVPSKKIPKAASFIVRNIRINICLHSITSLQKQKRPSGEHTSSLLSAPKIK